MKKLLPITIAVYVAVAMAIVACNRQNSNTPSIPIEQLSGKWIIWQPDKSGFGLVKIIPTEGVTIVGGNLTSEQATASCEAPGTSTVVLTATNDNTNIHTVICESPTGLQWTLQLKFTPGTCNVYTLKSSDANCNYKNFGCDTGLNNNEWLMMSDMHKGGIRKGSIIRYTNDTGYILYLNDGSDGNYITGQKLWHVYDPLSCSVREFNNKQQNTWQGYAVKLISPGYIMVGSDIYMRY